LLILKCFDQPLYAFTVQTHGLKPSDQLVQLLLVLPQEVYEEI